MTMLFAGIGLVVPLLVSGQGYPSKPIHVIVPLEPGGAIDIAARRVAPKMQEMLGQPIVIENRGGAAGQIGTQLVARAAPDGYTILFTIGGAHVLSMFAYKSLPYHPVRDFTPITAVADSILGISASGSFPANNFRELIAYAKRNPGKVSYGHTGAGGVTHLAMEQIRELTGTQSIAVPFKGGGPLTANLAGGQLDVGVLPVVSVMSQLKSGKIKLLGILGTRRFAPLPDVAAVSEDLPGFEMLEGTGAWVFGPAGMHADVVERLHAAIAAAVHAPEMAKQLETTGQIPNGESPAALAAQVQSVAKLGEKLMKLAGVQPE